MDQTFNQTCLGRKIKYIVFFYPSNSDKKFDPKIARSSKDQKFSQRAYLLEKGCSSFLRIDIPGEAGGEEGRAIGEPRTSSNGSYRRIPAMRDSLKGRKKAVYECQNDLISTRENSLLFRFSTPG